MRVTRAQEGEWEPYDLMTSSSLSASRRLISSADSSRAVCSVARPQANFGFGELSLANASSDRQTNEQGPSPRADDDEEYDD